MAGRKKQDVSAPPKPTRRRSPAITKADLDAAIAPLATKAEIAELATKAELAAAIAPLATKAELAAAIAPLATKAEMYEALDAWAQRLREVINQDIARHIGAAMEQMQVWISTLDDKYSDLPARVSAIEARLDGNGK